MPAGMWQHGMFPRPHRSGKVAITLRYPKVHTPKSILPYIINYMLDRSVPPGLNLVP
jgi:hypothetical protein